MIEDDPKPPAPTGWITMTEVSDGPGSAAIYGVTLLGLVIVVSLAVLLA